MNTVTDMIPAIELNQLDVPTKLPVFYCSLNQFPDALRLAREAIDDVRLIHPDSTPSNVRAVYMSPWKSHLISPKFNPLLDLSSALATRVSREFLQADLQALAGPSAGPGGGAIFIDGFSGGQLPSKESIREIRINQNPFSPE